MFRDAFNLLILFILTALVYYFSPRRIDFEGELEDLLRKTPPAHYQDMMKLLQAKDDEEFWIGSFGILGLLARIKISYAYLRMVNLFRKFKKVTFADAQYFRGLLLGQMLYSARAVIQHKTARQSVVSYCHVVTEGYSLLVQKDAPKCILRLRDLL
jgi:hypothetical protein